VHLNNLNASVLNVLIYSAVGLVIRFYVTGQLVGKTTGTIFVSFKENCYYSKRSFKMIIYLTPVLYKFIVFFVVQTYSNG